MANIFRSQVSLNPMGNSQRLFACLLACLSKVLGSGIGSLGCVCPFSRTNGKFPADSRGWESLRGVAAWRRGGWWGSGAEPPRRGRRKVVGIRGQSRPRGVAGWWEFGQSPTACPVVRLAVVGVRGGGRGRALAEP